MKEKMVAEHEFFLSREIGARERAIVKWFNSLTPDKQAMVRELQSNALLNDSYHQSPDQ